MKTSNIVISAIVATAALLPQGCVPSKQFIPPNELSWRDSGNIDILAKDGTIYSFRASQVRLTGVFGLGTMIHPDGSREDFKGEIPMEQIAMAKADKVDAAKNLLTYGVGGVLLAATIRSMNVSGAGVKMTASVKYPVSGGGGFWGSSCPFVYTFDGEHFNLESETFAGAVCKGLERQNLDVLSHLREVDGVYRLVIANQSPESHFTNEVTLLAIDHPAGTRVIPDQSGRILTIRETIPPVKAYDRFENSVIDRVTSIDDIFWESDLDSADPDSSSQYRDGIICEFPKPAGSTAAKLVISGVNTSLGFFALERLFSMQGPEKLHWYDRLNNDPREKQRLISWIAREGGLNVYLWQDNGWVKTGWLLDVGPLVTSEKIVALDLGNIKEKTVRIRLECALDLWRIDAVSIDYSDDEKIEIRELTPRSAITEDKINVAEQIRHADSSYFSTLPGQYATVEFDAVPLVPGKARSFVLNSSGYYYTWIDDMPEYHGDLADKIMATPGLGGKLYYDEWKRAKPNYTSREDFPQRVGQNEFENYMRAYRIDQ